MTRRNRLSPYLISLHLPSTFQLCSAPLPLIVCRNGCATAVTAILAPHPVLKLQSNLACSRACLICVANHWALVPDAGPLHAVLLLASGIWHLAFQTTGVASETLFLRRCLRTHRRMNTVQGPRRIEKDVTERTPKEDEDILEAMVGKKRIPSPDQLRDYNYAVAGQ